MLSKNWWKRRKKINEHLSLQQLPKKDILNADTDSY
jgi:hypothetical protein